MPCSVHFSSQEESQPFKQKGGLLRPPSKGCLPHVSPWLRCTALRCQRRKRTDSSQTERYKAVAHISLFRAGERLQRYLSTLHRQRLRALERASSASCSPERKMPASAITQSCFSDVSGLRRPAEDVQPNPVIAGPKSHALLSLSLASSFL